MYWDNLGVEPIEKANESLPDLIEVTQMTDTDVDGCHQWLVYIVVEMENQLKTLDSDKTLGAVGQGEIWERDGNSSSSQRTFKYKHE